jgi:oxaloacetate decarboxylase beta subunit
MDALLLQFPWLDELLMGFLGLGWKHVVMCIISGLLIYLAVRKGYEPNLLLPIGFGALLANIPASYAVSQVVGEEGFLWTLWLQNLKKIFFLQNVAV